jgi:cell division protease FtsH
MMMMKQHQTTGVLITTLLLLSVLFAYTLLLNQQADPVKPINYTEFLAKVQRKELSKVIVRGSELEALGKPVLAPAPAKTTASKAAPVPPEGTVAKKPTAPAVTEPWWESPLAANAKKATTRIAHYSVNLPAGATLAWLPKLEAGGVAVEVQPPEKEGLWWSIAGSLIFPLLLGLMLFLVYRNMASGGGGQAFSFGKSKAKLMVESNIKITFKDVAGINEAKGELEEVVDFLKNAERYQKLGAKIPKGVLLVGSPGTGKTLLAKAVAGEAGVPFFTISGSDFVEMFVGVGASRVRDLFEQAKKQAPCIIFIDEIDAVGRQRGAGMGGGHDEREQTLNQMLVEMDGFDGTTGIIIIAATNRPDILDNALLRPGRFDRQVTIDKPDLQGREQILAVHSKGKPLTETVDVKRLAKRTSGFSGADLANLLNEAALLAARRNKEVIDMVDVEDSIDRVVMGLEKRSKLISEKDKEITAYHEIGHALTCVLTPCMDPIRKVTIVPRGMALGYAWYAPEEETEQVSLSKTRILGEIAVALGGRVAEELVFDEVTTGASNDLQKVSKMARALVTAYGMSESLGTITYGERNEHVFMGRDFGTQRNYSETIATEIDREVKRIVDEQYAYVRTLLAENRDMMDALAKALLEKETLDDTEIKAILDNVRAKRSA